MLHYVYCDITTFPPHQSTNTWFLLRHLHVRYIFLGIDGPRNLVFSSKILTDPIDLMLNAKKTHHNTDEIITFSLKIALWGLVISKLQRTRGFLLVKCLDCINVTKLFEFFKWVLTKLFFVYVLKQIFVLLAMPQTDFIETHVCNLWGYSNSNKSTLILKVCFIKFSM